MSGANIISIGRETTHSIVSGVLEQKQKKKNKNNNNKRENKIKIESIDVSSCYDIKYEEIWYFCKISFNRNEINTLKATTTIALTV